MKFELPDWHDELPSTNSTLLNRLKQGDTVPNGYVLAARQQTAGRGRYDRTWVSRPGRDLTFSFLLRTETTLERQMSLTMAVALAVAEMLADLGIAARTKWPNDVLVGSRKIAGILAERHAGTRNTQNSEIVVGIGLNVNLTEAEAMQIDRPATSILIESRRVQDVGDVLARLLRCLTSWVGRWSESGFAGIEDAWLESCCYLGELITVAEQSGTLIGFGEQGQLLLRNSVGIVEPVWAGDVDILH